MSWFLLNHTESFIAMSASCGDLNWSTQHIIFRLKDGVWNIPRFSILASTLSAPLPASQVVISVSHITPKFGETSFQAEVFSAFPRHLSRNRWKYPNRLALAFLISAIIELC
jgi:hypothetical protein